MDKMRLKAAGKVSLIHFGISLLIAMLAAIVVLGIWFPGPYRSLAGGLHLFMTLVVVDVVCGPLLTFIIFNPKKSKRERIIDFFLVATIQLAALLYGLYSIGQARPILLVYEVDRFVAVSRAQIDPEDWGQALPEYRQFSWWSGPDLVGTRQPKDGGEMLESVELSIKGKEPSLRPAWWQPYTDSVPQVKSRMKPLSDLRTHHSEDLRHIIDRGVRKVGIPIENLFYLPLTTQKKLDDWVVVLDLETKIVGYIQVDGFK